MGEIIHEMFVSVGHILHRMWLWILEALHPIGWKLLLLYALLAVVVVALTRGDQKREKSLAQNIGPKLIVLAVAELIILGLVLNVGPMVYVWKFISSFIEPAVTIDSATKFPWWWVVEFAAFGVVGFLFFVLLDLPALGEQKGAKIAVNLVITYVLLSVLYTGFTIALPQFDPQYEIAEINKPPIKIADADSPEAVKAGREVFDSYKCFNCHKIWEEGSSDRGPNLGSHQIGRYSKEYIKKQIVDPRYQQAPGFDDPKSVKAMPDYYGEDIEGEEMTALLAFLSQIKDPRNMPVEGKLGEQWTWWDDSKIVEEGKAIYEGANPAVNCSVCHGKDGTPMMQGAFDFRDPNRLDEAVTSTDAEFKATMSKKPLKDWPDEVWIARVTGGIPGSAMAEWKLMEEEAKLLKAVVYARTFHDPLDKRSGKKPLPEIKTPPEFKKFFE